MNEETEPQDEKIDTGAIWQNGKSVGNLEMQTVIKENPMTQLHELFCITPDEDVYTLVEPN